MRVREGRAGGGARPRRLMAPAQAAGSCLMRVRERPRGRGEAAARQRAGARRQKALAQSALCREAVRMGKGWELSVYFCAARARRGRPLGVRVRVRCGAGGAAVARVPLGADLICCGALRRPGGEAQRFGVRGLQRKPWAGLRVRAPCFPSSPLQTSDKGRGEYQQCA